MAWWLFQNLVVTAALAVFVWIVCRAARIGPVGRHALWVIVLVKFVTPPLIVWPWGVPDPLGVAAWDDRRHASAPDRSAIEDGAPFLLDSADVSEPLAMATPSGNGDRDQPAMSISTWVFGGWIGGSVLLALIEAIRIARFARRLRSARPVDRVVVDRVRVLAAQLGVGPVPVIGLDDLGSPLVWGITRPRLIWPSAIAGDASGACVDGLIVHELAHIRRADTFVGWIELVAGVLWWWNPLFWCVRSARREQAELACDAWVVSALPDGRRAYAESLLAIAMAAPAPAPSSAFGVRAGTRRALERRLVMIMKGRASVRLPWVGLIAIGLLGAATMPAFAIAQKPVKARETTKALTVASDTIVATKPATTRLRAIRADVPGAVQATTAQTPQKKPVIVERPARLWAIKVAGQDLPADGAQLVKDYDADLAALREELERKMEARREALAKALQDLQDRYTKEGKLDEAVAIRDYLRAGLPGKNRFGYVIRKAPGR